MSAAVAVDEVSPGRSMHNCVGTSPVFCGGFEWECGGLGKMTYGLSIGSPAPIWGRSLVAGDFV